MLEGIDGILNALDQSAVAIAVRESLYLYPVLETLHVIGLALVFGSILAFDLRVLGLHKALPLGLLGRHLLPWVWAGFALNAASGFLLFASDAVDFSTNVAFQAKLVLLGLAGANALLFARRFHPAKLGVEDTRAVSPWPAKLSAGLSIVLWLSIITAGRMMAYVK